MSWLPRSSCSVIFLGDSCVFLLVAFSRALRFFSLSLSFVTFSSLFLKAFISLEYLALVLLLSLSPAYSERARVRPDPLDCLGEFLGDLSPFSYA